MTPQALCKIRRKTNGGTAPCASVTLLSVPPSSVTIGLRLEWPSDLDADIVCLLLRERREFGTERGEVQSSHLLIKLLGQQIDVVLVALALLPILQQVELTKHLVGEGARHHERRVPSGTTEVKEAARGEDNNPVAIWEDKTIHLRFDVLDLDAWEPLEFCHLYLVVEMANVTNNGVILHFLHVLQPDDIEVACSSDEDINLANYRLERSHLEALHARLQSADRITFRNHDTSASTTHRKGRAFAHVAVAADKHTLTTNHHIGGAHDSVGKRVTATIHVVKLGLCHAIVHVDCGKEQLTLGSHLLQPVHTSSGFFANAMASPRHPRVLGLIRWDGVFQQLQDTLELRVVRARGVRQGAVLGILLFKLLTLVDQQRGIAAIIHEQIAAISS